jgi:type II restriction enzyme
MVAYQLKSKSGPFGQRVQNSAYEPKMRAIRQGKAPHYAFLQYSRETWRVTDLFIVPGHFFTPALIERRGPLATTARRAGRVGSNILLQALPSEARLDVVIDGRVRPSAEVRGAWSRFAFRESDQRARGGWGAAVLASVRVLQKKAGIAEFSLQGFYQRFEAELGSRFPANRNVQAKIRQQLQVLRDGAVLEFIGRGRYRVLG